MTSETSFAPLPVRRRGTIEVIDTALKLYRRYFGVLMGWSVLVGLVSLLGSYVPFVGLLMFPLVYGSCACAVAAAVRGQRITFGQVWDFTKPRYGALILLVILSGIMLFLAVLALGLGGLLISVMTIAGLSALSAPDAVLTTLGIIGFVAALVLGSVISVLAYAWLGLVPLVACLEDDKRGAAAMGRAWELMKGSWLRVLGLSTLLTVAILAVMSAVAVTLALTGQGFSAYIENPDSLLGLSLAFNGTLTLFLVFWNPIQSLILSVLYLDLRVRKEALDLEWTSYTSVPQPVVGAPASVAAPAFDNAAPGATALPGATPFPDAATLFGGSPAPLPATASAATNAQVPAEMNATAPPSESIFASQDLPPSPFAPQEAAPSPFAPDSPVAQAPRPPAPPTELEAATEMITRPPAPQNAPQNQVQTAPEAFDFSSAFGQGEVSSFGGDPISGSTEGGAINLAKTDDAGAGGADDHDDDNSKARV